MERKLGYLFGLVLLVACADSRPLPTPTSPTPMTPVPAPCPPCPLPGAHDLSGVVRLSGVPFAGAQVGLVRLGAVSNPTSGPEELIASVATDGNGSYSFPSVENVSFSGALVSVSKAGYFTDTKYILMSGVRQLDVDLEPAIDIAVGEVIRGQVDEARARCASAGYGGMGGAICRRLALPVQATGTLEVTILSSLSAPFDVTVLRPNGTIGVNASSSSPLKVTLAVTAGLTYQIDVVHVNAASRAFELTTTLR